MGNTETIKNEKQIPEWNVNRNYYVGNIVRYNGRKYECIQNFFTYSNARTSIENPQVNFTHWIIL